MRWLRLMKSRLNSRNTNLSSTNIRQLSINPQVAPVLPAVSGPPSGAAVASLSSNSSNISTPQVIAKPDPTMPDLVSAAPLIELVKAEAVKAGLDPVLMCAIAEQESGWNQYAIRYEPLFMARYVAPLYTAHKISATEAWARAYSWSLHQLMGQVARENGFTGPFLSQLCDPVISVPIACKVFLGKMKISGNDVPKALQHWNGGGNPLYAGEVLARLPHYQK